MPDFKAQVVVLTGLILKNESTSQGGIIMKIGDKIMSLRKERGYSQEELASLIGVSRQSVSKWELNDSVPDLDKIVRISELFDISTDELIRDNIKITAEQNGLTMNDSEVQNCLTVTEENAPLNALAVVACILSPITLIVLGGGYDYGFFHNLFHSEDQAGAAGMVVLLVFIALGTMLFVYTSSRSSQYSWIEKNPVLISQTMYRLIRQRKEQSSRLRSLMLTAGICLIILSLIPLFLTYAVGEIYSPFGLGIMLGMIALGVGLIVYSSQNYDVYQQLLQEGDYTLEKKAVKKKYSWIPGVYWLTITTIFLFVSFIWDSWKYSWIIMASGGILYAALVIFLNRKVSADS